MKFNSVLIAIVALVAVGVIGFVIESEGQEHDLGLENVIPEERDNESTLDGLPGIPVAENAVLRVVGERDGYLVVKLLIKHDGLWRTAKFHSPEPGIQLLSNE